MNNKYDYQVIKLITHADRNQWDNVRSVLQHEMDANDLASLLITLTECQVDATLDNAATFVDLLLPRLIVEVINTMADIIREARGGVDELIF